MIRQANRLAPTTPSDAGRFRHRYDACRSALTSRIAGQSMPSATGMVAVAGAMPAANQPLIQALAEITLSLVATGAAERNTAVSRSGTAAARHPAMPSLLTRQSLGS